MSYSWDFTGLTAGDSITDESGWTKLTGANEFTISSGAASCGVQSDSGSGEGAAICPDQSDADHATEITLITGTLGNTWPAAVRVVDIDNWVGANYAGTGSAGMRIYKCDAGTVTQIASGQSSNTTPQRIKLTAIGTDYELLEDDLLGGGYASICSATVSDMSTTETSQGMICSSNATGTTGYFDDFVATAAGTPSLTPAALAHGHSLATGALTQHHSLAPAALDHNHSLATATLTAHHSITPAALDHGQTLDSGSLTQHHANKEEGTVVVATPSTGSGGGWWAIYDFEMQRRKDEQKRRLKLKEAAEKIQAGIDRELALEFRKQEAEAARLEELARLSALAKEHQAIIEKNLNERVIHAAQRAFKQGNFSAMEALERELSRAKEEELFLIMAFQIIINQ